MIGSQFPCAIHVFPLDFLAVECSNSVAHFLLFFGSGSQAGRPVESSVCFLRNFLDLFIPVDEFVRARCRVVAVVWEGCRRA